MFKNFNWKRYIIHVAISWGIFMFSLGLVSEFKAQSKNDNNVWYHLGTGQGVMDDVPMSYELYALKRSLSVSPSGNPIITIKVVYGNLGEVVIIQELDCDKNLARIIKIGKNIDDLMDVTSSYVKPLEGSAGDFMLKVICPKFKE